MNGREWKRLRTTAEVRRLLLGALPPGTDAQTVVAYAAAKGLEFSPPDEGVIRASAPARGRWPWISAKWLIVFHVPDGTLTDIEVDEGLTGP